MGILGRNVMNRICVGICLLICLAVSTPFMAQASEPLIVADAPALLTGLIGLAAQKGYFTNEGLDVRIIDFKTGDEATRAMFEGRADIATVAETAFVFDSFREKDFSLFATIGSWDNEVKIVAREDRKINSIGDLRGKRVATQGRLSTHYFLHQALLKHGLTMADIKPVFRKAAELPAALEAGEIDAFAMREPFIGEARQRLGNRIKLFEEPGLYWKTFNLLARNATLKQRSSAIIGFLRALHKAEKFLQERPQDAVRILAERLKSSPDKMAGDLSKVKLRLTLEQRLIYVLENVADWAISEKLISSGSVPNFMPMIYRDALLVVKPNSVTIIK